MSASSDPDRFLTIGEGAEAEVKVRGSRFIGKAFHVLDDASAAANLEHVQRRHHAARHHCWASRIGGPAAPRERCDDAGEPSGTAGRPILARLARREIHDALVVVTRYFGGTKLGTGGLARAYGEAAEAALDAASVTVVRLETRLSVRCAFDDLGAVEATLARAGPDVLAVERDFVPAPRLVLRVGRSRADGLSAAIVEATAGRATVAVLV